VWLLVLLTRLISPDLSTLPNSKLCAIRGQNILMRNDAEIYPTHESRTLQVVESKLESNRRTCQHYHDMAQFPPQMMVLPWHWVRLSWYVARSTVHLILACVPVASAPANLFSAPSVPRSRSLISPPVNHVRFAAFHSFNGMVVSCDQDRALNQAPPFNHPRLLQPRLPLSIV
jgi:hypothetical protein